MCFQLDYGASGGFDSANERMNERVLGTLYGVHEMFWVCGLPWDEKRPRVATRTTTPQLLPSVFLAMLSTRLESFQTRLATFGYWNITAVGSFLYLYSILRKTTFIKRSQIIYILVIALTTSNVYCSENSPIRR